MKRFSLILILAGVALALAPTQLAAGWWRTYGGEENDYGYCVQQTQDEGYIVSGYNGAQDAVWLIKTDAEGNTVWDRIYNTEGNESNCVQQTSDGGYIVSANYAGLIKTNVEGGVLWSHGYGFDINWVEQTSDEGYIATGIYLKEGQPMIGLLKTDSEGDTSWMRTYRIDGAYCWGYCVRQTKDGGYIVTGEAYKSWEFAWLLKVDEVGDSVWSRKLYESDVAAGQFVEQTTDGGYIVVGDAGEIAGQGYDYYPDLLLIKADTEGNTVWRQFYSGERYTCERGWCVREVLDGEYILSGYVRGELWIFKTDEQGNLLWTRSYGGSSEYRRSYIQQTNDLGYIIVGTEGHSSTQGWDLLLIKTDSLGLIGVEEEPIADVTSSWEVTPIGSEIVLRFTDRPQGFHAAIFNASGQKVDELHSDLQASTITWGRGMSPGVYFIMPTDGELSKQKVILIR